VVLTKNQAVLAYKIALAVGMPADFKSVMPQLAGVVGGGFLLRQAARSLVGWIPAFGIPLKIAIAFAGTFVVGEAVYRWCTTGERMSGDAMRQVYEAALNRGREIAASLLQRRARPVGRASPVDTVERASPAVTSDRQKLLDADKAADTGL